MMETVSVHLPFEGIQNCRDMAGIPNKNGRTTRPGLLYRSANLHHATDHDLYTLGQMKLDSVVDLRTYMEADLEPDRLLDTWHLYHLPIINEEKLAQSQGGQLELAEEALRNTGDLVEKIYPQLVMTDNAIEMWKAFFRRLIDNPGSYLWHCTQGKDRTGMAAILLLSALEVEESLILADYLQTNLYLAKDLEKEEQTANALLGKRAVWADSDLAAMDQARRSYYDSARKAVFEKYGSWKGYLEQALKLSPEDFTALQDYYLE